MWRTSCVRGDLVDRALGEDRALVQDGHALRDLAHEGDVVLDDDDGEARRLRCCSTRAVCIVSSGDMPAVGSSSSRIVGPAGQHHGDLQPLQLVVRQLARRLSRCPRSSPKQLERVAVALLGRRLRAAPRRAARVSRFCRTRQGVEGAIGLEGEAQAQAHAPERPAAA